MLEPEEASCTKKMKLQESSCSEESKENIDNPNTYQLELSVFMGNYFPNIGNLYYDTTVEKDSVNGQNLYRCKVNLFGDIIESFETFPTENKAKEHVAELALFVMRKFTDLVCNPTDEIQKNIVEMILDDLNSYKPEGVIPGLPAITSAALNLPKINPNHGDPTKRSEKYLTTYWRCLELYSNRKKVNVNHVYRGEKNKYLCEVYIIGQKFESDLFDDKYEAKENASKKAWNYLKSLEADDSGTVDASEQISKEAYESILSQKASNDLINFEENISKTNFQKHSKKYIDMVNSFWQMKYKKLPFYTFKSSLSKFICTVEMNGVVFESFPYLKKSDAKEDVAKKIYEYLQMTNQIVYMNDKYSEVEENKKEIQAPSKESSLEKQADTDKTVAKASIAPVAIVQPANNVPPPFIPSGQHTYPYHNPPPNYPPPPPPQFQQFQQPNYYQSYPPQPWSVPPQNNYPYMTANNYVPPANAFVQFPPSQQQQPPYPPPQQTYPQQQQLYPHHHQQQQPFNQQQTYQQQSYPPQFPPPPQYPPVQQPYYQGNFSTNFSYIQGSSMYPPPPPNPNPNIGTTPEVNNPYLNANPPYAFQRR